MSSEWGWVHGKGDVVAIVYQGHPVVIFDDMQAAKNWYWMCGIMLRGMDKLGQIEPEYDAILEARVHLDRAKA